MQQIFAWLVLVLLSEQTPPSYVPVPPTASTFGRQSWTRSARLGSCTPALSWQPSWAASSSDWTTWSASQSTSSSTCCWHTGTFRYSFPVQHLGPSLLFLYQVYFTSGQKEIWWYGREVLLPIVLLREHAHCNQILLISTCAFEMKLLLLVMLLWEKSSLVP